LVVGLALHLLGHGGLWLVARGHLSLGYHAVVFVAVVAFSGGCWIDTATVCVSLKNFPRRRGTAVGLLKSMVGLSASVFTAVYVAAFRPRVFDFLLFLALAPAALGLLATALVNQVPCVQAPGSGMPPGEAPPVHHGNQSGAHLGPVWHLEQDSWTLFGSL
jgi:Nodulin-like